MNRMLIALSIVPICSIALLACHQLWDEVFSNKRSSPIRSADWSTHRVQFGVDVPIVDASAFRPSLVRNP
jgi:hypothetical protein